MMRLFSLNAFLMLVLAIILQACTTQPENFNDKPKERAQAHADLGAVYLQQGRLDVALEEFSLASKIEPSYAAAYNGLGLVQAALGQDAVAELNFKKAVQLEPLNSEAHNNYGSFLCARNRLDESIKEFMAALKNPLYATPVMAYTNAAVCSLRKNDSVQAEGYLLRALQLDPLASVAAYQLAAIQFKRKDALAAKKTLQAALSSKASADMLWLAIQIERALGDANLEASYALELRQNYPESEQAQLLQGVRP
ncbi:PilF Tfp pilus assembly protein PilF [Methylophilaceae bacterium]|jgi:type IV pilus assembly protein PilF